MSFLQIAFTLTILTGVYLQNNDIPGSPPDMVIYDNYYEGLQIAQVKSRPVFLLFTGITSRDNIELKKLIKQSGKITRMLNDHYINVWLYVDDPTLLPEKETVTIEGNQQTIHTYGEKWAALQWQKFAKRHQPLMVVMDEQGHPLTQPKAYTSSEKEILHYLKTGVRSYNEE